jgi:catechol 2,3-dioxygenase-like lactoylglutathione lyase family enzyme
MTVSEPALHHVALTVRNLDASVQWYCRVFGLRVVMDVPHPGGLGRLLLGDAQSLAIVLHRHDSNDGDTFLETRTGLDHVGMVVPAREDLVAWQAHLEEQGVVRAAVADRPCTQSDIADEPYGSVLVFRDPDNLQLELFCTPAPTATPTA